MKIDKICNNKEKKINSKGFTLAELLVVVAIIAVLVAVSIPIFTGQLDKAKEATCEANRRALRAVLVNEYLTDETNAVVADGNHNLTNEQKKEYVCPEGGTITYKVNKADNIISIYCSVHAKQFVFGNTETMSKVMDILGKLNNTIDSTATDGNNPLLTNALEEFQKAGIDMSSVKAWKYTTEYSGLLFFSSQPIPQDKPTTMYIVQYRKDTGNYTVWPATTELAKNKDGTESYYIFNGHVGKEPLNGEGKENQTYEKALEKYNELIGN